LAGLEWWGFGGVVPGFAPWATGMPPYRLAVSRFLRSPSSPVRRGGGWEKRAGVMRVFGDSVTVRFTSRWCIGVERFLGKGCHCAQRSRIAPLVKTPEGLEDGFQMSVYLPIGEAEHAVSARCEPLIAPRVMTKTRPKPDPDAGTK